MAVPRLPWYSRIERIVAPSEPVTNVVLGVIVLVTLLVLVRGNATVKAAWAVYMVSP